MQPLVPHPFADIHYDFVNAVISALNGDASRYLILFPRGGGKTTLSFCLLTYLLLNNVIRFPLFISASRNQSRDVILRWFSILHSCKDLLNDYPVAQVVVDYSRKNSRANILSYKGEKILAQHTQAQFYVDDCKYFRGFCLKASSVQQALRGLQAVFSGVPHRPDFVIVDDPQDRAIAKSPARTRKIVDTIEKDIVGLASLGKTLPMFCLGTIISSGDVIDSLAKLRTWKVIHRRLLEGSATNPELWEQYIDIYQTDKEKAHNFYLSHKDKMDAGLSCSWQHAKQDDDVSSIEYAMRTKLLNPDFFNSELQNEVPELITSRELEFSIDDLTKAEIDIPQFEPRAANSHKILAVDLGSTRNWYLVAEITPTYFHILSYGAFPQLVSNNPDDGMLLEQVFPDREEVDRVMLGLDEIIKEIRQHIDLDLIVVNPYRTVTQRVLEFASRQPGKILAFVGRYTTPDNPLTIYGTKNHHTAWGVGKDRSTGFPVFYADVNFFKTRFANLIKCGKMSIHKGIHILLKKSLLSEMPTVNYTRAGASYIVWSHISTAIPNHFWDCCIMAYAAAFKEGIIEPPQLKKVSFAQLAKEKLKYSE